MYNLYSEVYVVFYFFIAHSISYLNATVKYSYCSWKK